MRPRDVFDAALLSLIEMALRVCDFGLECGHFLLALLGPGAAPATAGGAPYTRVSFTNVPTTRSSWSCSCASLGT